jgi:hypothetical protein
MKILITNEIYEEMIINFMVYYRNTTYLKMKNNAINMNNILYRFLLSSSIIEEKIKSILLCHLNGDYNKAYEVLIYQSDVINDFYDSLIKVLIEIEYLEFLKNLSFIIEYKYDDNSFYQRDDRYDDYRSLFLKKRNKVIKFFNIDIISIFKRLDSFDFTNISDQINYLYNVIIDLLYVLLFNLGIQTV